MLQLNYWRVVSGGYAIVQVYVNITKNEEGTVYTTEVYTALKIWIVIC